ncbi:hypothetical protein [Mycobacteroides chelonae]|uniref:Uncharacterized protein n=1 Tax=Mycobacteroides chelonae TaxID=1774 RepID=A0AB73U603_MYCCH|nr:hypothetical protein [Mycobacteroides chelonae]MEC4842633.1 hypothetical protein [Mycobacteroides chelonae]MEC4847474.1 hypothetical protein [Mycobacteroides chelonae]OLT80553.1 hypothetical protein BKG57_11155 [Mycobacteroides chelonae]QDF71895.1 hypothetical protein FJK96_18205 [Mycobacteroides chelonae]
MSHRSTQNQRKAIEQAVTAGEWTTEKIGLFIRRYASPDRERIADVRYTAKGVVKAAVVYPRFGLYHQPVRLRGNVGREVVEYIEHRDAEDDAEVAS